MWQRLNFLGRRTVTAVMANRHLSFARGVWKLARLRLAAVGEVTHQVPGRRPRAGAQAAAGALLGTAENEPALGQFIRRNRGFTAHEVGGLRGIRARAGCGASRCSAAGDAEHPQDGYIARDGCMPDHLPTRLGNAQERAPGISPPSLSGCLVLLPLDRHPSRSDGSGAPCRTCYSPPNICSSLPWR